MHAPAETPAEPAVHGVTMRLPIFWRDQPSVVVRTGGSPVLTGGDHATEIKIQLLGVAN